MIKGLYDLGPVRWFDSAGWKISFWDDFFESDPKALACYREEVAIIEATDNLSDYQ